MPAGIYNHRPLSEETKNKIRLALLGRKHSVETKEKRSLGTVATQFKEGHKTNIGKIRPDLSELNKIFKKGKRMSPNTEFKKGHNVPKEWIEKMRQRKKGIISNKYGKTYEVLYGDEKAKEIRNVLSQRHKNKKLSETHRSILSDVHKRKFSDENFRRQWATRFHKKPGLLEEKLIQIINSNNLPFMYCGNYSFWVSNKNPDFINTQGKKLVIELMGEYWHKKRNNIRFHQTFDGTIEHYKKFGFNCLVIWDYELKQPEKVL